MKKKETVNQNARIFIVEDELLTAENIKRTLQKYGYDIIGISQSASDAVKFVKQTKPDLILMDIMLKGKLSGIDAAEKIRKIADIPVIYLTAFSDDDTISKAKLTSPFGYIIKPFENRELYSVIEMALYKHSIEMKLKENEENLFITLNSIGDGVISTDSKGHIIRMNPIAEKLCGWKLKDAAGKPLKKVFQIIDAGSRNPVKNPVEEVIKSGKTIELSNHTILISKNGKEINISDSAAPIKDKNGNIHGVVLVFADVTEAYKSRELIRKSEEKFRDLFETMPTGFYRSTPEGYFIDANPAFIKMLGYESLEELKNLYIPEAVYIHPDERLELTRSNPGLVEREETYPLKRKDGSIIWLEEFSRFVKDKNGKVIYNEGLCKDITDKKLAEERLRESEERYSLIVDASEQGIWDWDVSGNKMYISPQWKEQIGYLDEELENDFSVWAEHLHPEDRERCMNAVNNYFQNPTRHFILEFRFRHKDGSYRWIHNKSSSIIDDNGKVIRMFGAHTDTTEKKLAEEKARESELRLLSISENLPGSLMYQIDSGINGEERKFTFISKGVESMHQVSAEEVMQDAFILYNQVYDEDKQLLIETEREALEKITPLRVEARFKLPSGEIRWRHLSSAPRKISTGHVIWDGIEIDITDQKATEIKLKENQEKLRLLIELAPDAFFQGDKNGNIIYANDKAVELTGYSKYELFTKHIKDLFPPEVIENKPLRFDLLLKGDTVKAERDLVRKDGSIVPIEMNSRAMPDGTFQSFFRDIAERKENEKTIKNILTNLNKSQAVAHLGNWELDLETKIFSGSDEALNLWELNRFDHSFDKVTDKIYPDDLTDVLNGLNELIATGKPASLEFRLILKSGKIRSIRTMGELIRNQKGIPESIFGIVQDITEEKAAQEALRTSEELHRKLLITVPDLIIRTDIKGDIIFVNEYALSMIGYIPKENILGRNMLSFIAEKDLDRAIKNTKLMFEKQLGPQEYLIVFEDGKEMECEVNGDVILDSDSKPAGMVYVIRDITERKQSQRRLNYYNKRLELITKITSGVIGELSVETASERMLGELINAFEVDAGIIRVIGDKGLEVLSTMNVPDNSIMDVISPDFGLGGEIINTKKPRAVTDASKDPSAEYIQNYHENSFKFISYAGAPLLVKNEVIGLLGLYTTEEKREFSEEDLKHLQIAANHISVVIENNAMFTDLKTQKIILETEVMERKYTEESLRLSEERYKNLFDKSPVGILLIDENGYIINANDAFGKLSGYSLEEIIGNHVKMFAPAGNENRADENIKYLMNTGYLEHQVTSRRKDGSIHVIQLVENKIVLQNGRQGLLSISTDITEKIKAEEALRESEERFRSIINELNDTITIVDENRKISYQNSSGYNTFGFTEQEMIGKDPFEFVHPDDVPLVAKEFNDVVNKENSGIPTLFRVIRKNGSFAYIESTGLNMLDNKAVKGVVIVGKDVTEKVTADIALRQSEEEKAKILQATLSGMYVYDTVKRSFNFVNAAYTQITGWSINELNGMGEKFFELFHPADSKRAFDHYQGIADSKTDTFYFIEYRFRTKDARWIWLLSYDRAFERDDNGNVIRIIGSFIDSTKQKKIETALRESEQKYRDLFEKSRDAFFVLDKGMFIDCNQAATELLALEGKIDIIDKSPAELSPAKQYDGKDSSLKAAEMIELAFKNGSHRFEWIHRKSTGENFPAEVLLTPISTGGQKIVHAVVRDITQAKLAEESIRKSEEKYRNLFETMPNGYYRSTIEGRIVDANPAFIKMLGYNSLEELMKVNIPSQLYVNSGERDEIRNINPEFTSAIETYRLKKKDGSIIWIEDNARYIRNEKGEIIFNEGICKDITEQKETNEQLLILSRAVEQSQVSIVITDTDGNIKYVNPKFEEVTGYSFDEIHGKKPSILKSGLSDESFYRDMWNNILSGKNWAGVFTNKRKNGQIIIESAVISPITDSSDNITHFVAVKEDITELTKAQLELKNYKNYLEELVEQRTEELNRKNIFLRTLIDTIPNPVFVKDKDKNYTDVNKAFIDLLGLSFQKTIGLKVEDIVPEDTASQANEYDQKLIDNFDSAVYESKIKNSAGIYLPVMIYKASYGPEGGKPEGIVGLIIDISQIKETQKQMEIALEKERELNEMKTNFISLASHELRTPLTAIYSSAELLERFGKSWSFDKFNEHIGRIKNSVDSLTELMEDLLTLSRVETGKILFKPGMLNLRTVVEENIKAIESIKSKKHKLNINFTLTRENYLFDEKLLKYIIQNLLTNALKYSPSGGEIKLDVYEDNKEIKLIVRDEGIGVPEEDRKYLFEPFHRGLNVTGYTGTGLGLSIVKEAVELHGGKVEVESELNKWTKFIVSLPIK